MTESFDADLCDLLFCGPFLDIFFPDMTVITCTTQKNEAKAKAGKGEAQTTPHQIIILKQRTKIYGPVQLELFLD